MLFLFVFTIFVLVGGFTLLLLASLGDWRRLAKSFHARHKPDGKTFHFRSAAVGMVSYGNILTVCISAEGLYLAVFFPFRPMHPPLLIPWEKITAVREKNTFSQRRYRLSIGSPEWASLTLPEDIVREIKSFMAEKKSTSDEPLVQSE
ncbi:hypothetical protein Pan97_52230 [Bremerella volcania]|uniref:Uncharacterized protein n=1 Tax=Bremerella volcania TaxID=2527984 RepID=A0A518CFZ7_9BACT|nr:hypothetical protein [Bremerella volcania]QDU78141.1 hypothetical protein Pan97_52230 [Bremerella volcania]